GQAGRGARPGRCNARAPSSDVGRAMDRQRRRHRDQAPPLDLNMADRVLSGALAPEDLPPALGPMAQAIDSMRAAASPTDSMQAAASPTDSKRMEDDRRTIDSMVAFLAAA